MAIVFSLIERTVDRLRYLVTITTVSPAALQTGTIPNAAGATPDLLTDIGTAGAVVDGKTSGVNHGLREIIRARLDGFGPIVAGALNQAQARAILNSDDPGAVILINQVLGRAELSIEPRTVDVDADDLQLSVDANVDGDGDPVVEVQAFTSVTTGVTITAIVTIKFIHSSNR